MPIKNKFKPLLTQIILWSPVAIVVSEYVFSISKVKGRSMRPTLNPDTNELKQDVVILDKFSNLKREYERGEIVTLKSPSEPNKILIKRIIGLEGDIIQPKPLNLRSLPIQKRNEFNLENEEIGFNDKLIVNKIPDKICIPKNHCWVEGDDPFHSFDSNNFGPVPLGLITSKVKWRIYPFNRIGRIN